MILKRTYFLKSKIGFKDFYDDDSYLFDREYSIPTYYENEYPLWGATEPAKGGFTAHTLLSY